ncbi:CPBP family intramembrane glutamic endopeptidase [Chryseobacterium camelliae]|uniref:CPBP family intramembrane glutamic endopeptidase n=1 Tax=Chryseobacterium camelliae TaxID=1265445 RepID=UPI002864AA58|nr:type II CAAX endopeptidase family protein [Chryseobacterium camelliae]MDR6514591.1 membrane protease YdiL (CAAX protease family) [Chryseobacterium camelliae]
MENELKPLWRTFFSFNWKFGLFLILIICIPRFLLVLNANEMANYRYIGLIMLVSAVAPFIFLTNNGRKAIGMKKSAGKSWLWFAFLLGFFLSAILYVAGVMLYGHSIENWYIYIGKSYNIPNRIKENDKLVMFLIMAFTGMVFSPFGEELFFRGIVHSSFAKSLGNFKASLIDSSAFALTHLSHFGLIFFNEKWSFLPLPALIWVSGMFVVSLIFNLCRRKTGSLLGAIICHAAFNLGMIYTIFYLLN